MTKFYRDGTISEQSIAPFDFTDRGLLLGDGVFDTALVLGGRIFRGDAHLDRLFDASRQLGIAVDRGAITRAAEALAAHGGPGVLRTTVTRGPGPRGLRPLSPQRPTVFASLAALPTNVVFAPLTLDIAAIRRNESSPTSRLKTLNYLDAVLATAAAEAAGFDETLFMNCAGRVACAAAGNLFAVRGRQIVTPPVADGVLPGIVRAFILTECGGLERSLEIADVVAADAAFVTSSLRLIAPVTRIGDARLASTNNDVVRELQKRMWSAIDAECGITLPLPGGSDEGERLR
jgi:branched-chain amino acid aminotransferase